MSHHVEREPRDVSRIWDLLCSAIHIYWSRVDRGSQSERDLSCLSMACLTIVRGPAINLQAFRVLVWHPCSLHTG